MSIITKYVCDRCSKEQTTSDQMWDIGIKVSYSADAHRYNGATSHNQIWCRACCEALGLCVATTPEAKASIEAHRPTLEEIIREIAREEISQLTGAA